MSIYAAVYASYGAGLGLAAGAMWSLLQMWLLEKIVISLTSPDVADKDRLRRVWPAGLAHVGMLGVGALLLFKLPAIWLAAGFTLPFAIIFLKAVSRQLLESNAWKGFVSSKWKPALVLALVVAGLWFLSANTNRANAESATPAATTTETHATETHATEAPAAEHGSDAHATDAHATEGEHAAGEHAEGGHGEAAAGPKKFDTILSILAKAGHGTPWGDFIHHYEIVIFSLFVALALSLISMIAMRNPKMIPGPLQNAVEAVVGEVYKQICDILGPKYGPRYVPFLGSLFIYIFSMNIFGIVPLMESPTSNLNVTLALALTVFVYVQYSAIKESGPLGYLDHLAGSPRTAIEWGLVPLLFPIHVIGELA
ncbi:MAG: F0F1 ATP synthase subunit A, partial [Candidatus Eisenbacteria bacterium]|nr:F0F1 ATP synthase subunit A [Candidatus Eisenbacteria bacterium]